LVFLLSEAITIPPVGYYVIFGYYIFLKDKKIQKDKKVLSFNKLNLLSLE
jgi:hypothetical protein